MHTQSHDPSGSVKTIQQPVLSLELLAKARKLAHVGYGWEDIHSKTGLHTRYCRQIVLGLKELRA